MNILGKIEFAAARKTVLTEAEDYFRPIVEDALADVSDKDWFESVLVRVEEMFDRVYKSEAGDGSNAALRRRLVNSISATLGKTNAVKKDTANRIVQYLATATVNAATEAAAIDDPEPLSFEWVTMHDNSVRSSHSAADGQTRDEGEPFKVGGAEMRYPGDTTAPIEEWAGCRCVLRPSNDRVGALVAAAVDTSNLSVIVALPTATDPVHELGPEQSHMTMIFLGASDSIDGEAILAEMSQVAGSAGGSSMANVTGRSELGDDKAQVLNVDPGALARHRDELLKQPTIKAAYDSAEQYPEWTPHLTLGYPDQGDIGQDDPDEILFDRFALWHGDQQIERYMGENMTAAVTDEPIEESSDSPPEGQIDTPNTIPWHGVLAPEGVPSGDGRQFKANSLRNRDLPLPLTWQKASAEGHDGSVVVAMIQGLSRMPGPAEDSHLIHAYGVMIPNDESDEVVGQMAAFGKMGVSVDIDDATFDVFENQDQARMDTVEFTDARICSASIVSIPAFAEAYVTLGPAPEGFMGESPEAEISDEDMQVAVDGALAASAFKRGPGWVTDPVATNRIHRYWTEPGQPGFAKIAWGEGGDFNRCRVEVGKYLVADGDAKYVNATCAQWHHDALGYWPSTHAKALGGSHSLNQPEGVPISVNLVASAAQDIWTPPGAWFADPQLSELTPLTFVKTEEGTRIFGHCAGWGQCHVGFTGVCVEPFDSPTNFSYFNRSYRPTTDGPVYVGNISVGGGHPSTSATAAVAMAMYDDTSTTVADVHCGSDEHGIWFAGWVRPNVTEDPVRMAEFYGCTLSGDWRDFELRHILGVNEGGFQIPRTTITEGRQIGLVASGVIHEPAVILDNTEDKDESGPRVVSIDVREIGKFITQGITEYTAGLQRKALVEQVRERHTAAASARFNGLRAKHEES